MRVRITWNTPDGIDGKHTWFTYTSYCYYRVLKPDEGQEDLETENTPDGMDGEQTWPTEEELKEADQNGKQYKCYFYILICPSLRMCL